MSNNPKQGNHRTASTQPRPLLGHIRDWHEKRGPVVVRKRCPLCTRVMPLTKFRGKAKMTGWAKTDCCRDCYEVRYSKRAS